MKNLVTAKYPEGAPLHVSVLITVQEGDECFYLVGTRVHKDDPKSFVYYSPEHGEFFPVDNVVDWNFFKED